MKKVVFMCLCCIYIMLYSVGCSKTSDGQEKVETFVIETPYCNLLYPEKWENSVQIRVENGDFYKMEFSMSGTPLFDLNFDGGEGQVLGTLKSAEKNIVLRIIPYDFDSKDDQYETYCMMQEDVNVILNHLTSEYDFTVGMIVEDEDPSVFEIKTSIGSLYYPQKWKDRVTIDVQDNFVKFSTEGVQLFDLRFGGSEGRLIGTCHDTQVRIVSYDIEPDKISDQNYNDLCAMQEDINIVLQHLMEEPFFSLSK